MSAFQRVAVLWSSLLTGVSGAVYWWMDTMLEPAGEWAVVNHPLQPWVLKAHILVAPVLVFALGSIVVQHIWKHYTTRVRRGRRSGIVAMAVLGPMVISGYLIQTVISEPLLSMIVWTHLVTGMIFGIGLGVHEWVVTRPRAVARRVPRPTQAPTASASGSRRLARKASR